MQRKPIDKAMFFGVPAFLLALFVLRLNVEDDLKLAVTISSVGLLIGYVSYFRSRGLSKKYSIESLIEKENESVVFHYLHGYDRQPLKVNADTIYALNYSNQYLGVILDKNGRGFDFHYPHKEAVIKARLQEVLGEDGFNNVKKNV